MATREEKIKELKQLSKLKAEIPIKKGIPAVINEANENRSRKVKAIKDKCLFLYGKGEPFTLIKTGGSYKLESRLFNNKAVRGGFSMEDVRFIKSVKQYVMKNDVAEKFIGTDYLAKKIFYLQVNKYVEGEVLNDVVEIDIDRAYWETAYLMGVISKAIYVKGCEIDKRVRLAALGSLARRKEVWEFNGKVMKKKKDERSYATENVWFAICRRVSDVMQECVKLAGDAFVFYWVDGIYVRNDAQTIGKIMQCFGKYGYESKTKHIEEIVFHNNKFDVIGVVSGDKREFSYQPNKSKGTIRNYNEDLRLKELAKEIFGKQKSIMLGKNDEVEVL